MSIIAHEHDIHVYLISMLKCLSTNEGFEKSHNV